MNQQILDYLRRDKAIDDEILEALLCSHGSKRNDAQAIVKKIYKEERIDSIINSSCWHFSPFLFLKY